jgi:hypothetical protein
MKVSPIAAVGCPFRKFKYDWYCCVQRARGCAACSQKNIRSERNQFWRIPLIKVRVARAPAILDAHVAACDPSQLLQSLLECRYAGLTFWIVCGRVHKHADQPHLFGLLCTRGDRSCGSCAAEKRDEFPSSHCLSEAQDGASYRLNPMRWKGVAARPIQPRYVRFGSSADICTAMGHVRFTPNSDRESRFPKSSCPLYPRKGTLRSSE